MKCNVGKTDRMIRIAIGVILLILGISLKCWLLGILGVIALFTGICKFCALYLPLGISTCKKDSCCCGGSCDTDEVKEE